MSEILSRRIEPPVVGAIVARPRVAQAPAVTCAECYAPPNVPCPKNTVRGKTEPHGARYRAAQGTYQPEGTIEGLRDNELEAVARAEAVALLIRSRWKVYHPEADIDGEDLLVRPRDGEPRSVQCKPRPWVDWDKYHGKWMLFPDSPGPRRQWFMVEHDLLFRFWEAKYGRTKGWRESKRWHTNHFTLELRAFLAPFAIGSTEVIVAR